MPYRPRDFDSQLQVTLEALDRVSSKTEFFNVVADEVSRLTLTWGESHWDEIIQAAEKNRMLARGLGSADIPIERLRDAELFLQRLGIGRELHITVAVIETGPPTDLSYRPGKVTFGADLPTDIMEQVYLRLPEHLRIVCERELNRRRNH